MERQNNSSGETPVQVSVEKLRSCICASSSHTPADRDLALLARAELRPVRLQLEYLKPELAFAELGIEYAIVVFGSTRLLDPEIARNRLRGASS